mmetsp:Transcript_8947/g.24850  ORF Transcript_8947/g.24850 Transcript_8947/m.24850 type:complete len:306 (+) Transcript_8947:531-1448(+)
MPRLRHAGRQLCCSRLGRLTSFRCLWRWCCGRLPALLPARPGGASGLGARGRRRRCGPRHCLVREAGRRGDGLAQGGFPLWGGNAICPGSGSGGSGPLGHDVNTDKGDGGLNDYMVHRAQAGTVVVPVRPLGSRSGPLLAPAIIGESKLLFTDPDPHALAQRAAAPQRGGSYARLLELGKVHRRLLALVPLDPQDAAVHGHGAGQLVIAQQRRRGRKHDDRPGILARHLLLLVPSAALFVDEPQFLNTVQHVGNLLVDLLRADPVCLHEEVKVIGVLNSGGQEVVEIDSQQLCHLPLDEPVSLEV